MADLSMSAIDSATAAIRRIAAQSTVTGPGSFDYRIARDRMGRGRHRGGVMASRQRSATITLDAGRVAYGVMNTALAMNIPAVTALVSKAHLLQEDVRSFTPQGPPRDLPEQLSRGLPERALQVPMDSRSWDIWQAEGAKLLNELKETSSGGTDEMFLNRAYLVLKSRHKGFQKPRQRGMDQGGNLQGFGSLWLSIEAHAEQEPGAGLISAKSDNYYAGFVEEGFAHQLEPVLQRSTGGQIWRRKDIRANLTVARLGYYPWMDWSGDGVSVSGDAFQVGYEWDMKTSELGKGNNPASTMISWRTRQGGNKQPGVHMFAKGMAKFLTEQMPAWRKDVDRIFVQAWDQGKVWHEIDRQFRVRKGVTGQNRPGTYSSGLP